VPATQIHTITVDLFEDFVCPWCRIGRANLARAIEQWEGPAVVVRHRPFMLDPTIPPEGNDFRAHMEHKFGGRGSIDEMHEYVANAGSKAGLTFNFDKIRHAPNTLRAHRLVELAPESARESMAKELFDRYFEHGQDIGDAEVLADIARAHGMDEQIAYSLLSGEAATASIAASMREAQQLGITGVPFFVVDDQYGVSGAQPPEVLLQVLGMTTEAEMNDSPSR
jgi:predicted DsbA family dithiol-disulfide isomerase